MAKEINEHKVCESKLTVMHYNLCAFTFETHNCVMVENSTYTANDVGCNTHLFYVICRRKTIFSFSLEAKLITEKFILRLCQFTASSSFYIR